MGSPGYVAQRLWQAIDSLGEPTPEQLREAAVWAFGQLVFLNAEDFDDLDDRQAFESLMNRASGSHALTPDGEISALSDSGTISDSIQLLPEADLIGLVADLRSLHQKYPFPSE